MNKTFRSPEDHSGDWRFAARVPDSARRLTVHPDGMDTVLLVADEEGAWWAVPGACRQCGDSLEPTSKEVLIPAMETRCHACGTPHGPEVAGCVKVATLVVDEEIYLLAQSGTADRD